MTRVLVDASALIALARVGELSLLRELLGDAHTTPVVLAEAAHPDYPERETIEAAVKGGWLKLAPFHGDPASLRSYGLAAGEASLFLAAKADDVLLVDESNARRLADARGIRHLGLLGLLVGGVQEGRIPKDRGLAVLRKLADGTFRMSVGLYQWALQRISDSG